MRAVLSETPTLVESGSAFSCVIVERNAANVLNLHFTESPGVVAGAPAPLMACLSETTPSVRLCDSVG